MRRPQILSEHASEPEQCLGSGGFAGRLSTPLRTTLWLFRKYTCAARSGPRSFDRRFRAMWIIWEQTQPPSARGGLQALMDSGRGDVPLIKLRFRCSNCGNRLTDIDPDQCPGRGTRYQRECPMTGNIVSLVSVSARGAAAVHSGRRRRLIASWVAVNRDSASTMSCSVSARSRTQIAQASIALFVRSRERSLGDRGRALKEGSETTRPRLWR